MLKWLVFEHLKKKWPTINTDHLLYHLDKLNINFLSKRARNFFLILESSSSVLFSINKKHAMVNLLAIFCLQATLLFCTRWDLVTCLTWTRDTVFFCSKVYSVLLVDIQFITCVHHASMKILFIYEAI